MGRSREVMEYVNTLYNWWRDSDVSQGELATISRFFQFDPSKRGQNQAIDEKTFNKVINATKIPKRREGIYNLLAVLGTYYAKQIITWPQIQTFLQTHVHRFPDRQTIEVIQAEFEAGYERYRQKDIEPEPEPEPERNRSLVWVVLGILALLIVGAGIVLLWPKDDTPPEEAKVRVDALPPGEMPPSVPLVEGIDCGRSVDPEGIVFYGDQGFSLHGPGANGGSIISSDIRSLGVNEQGLWVGYGPRTSPIDKISLFDGKKWTHYCLGRELAIDDYVNDFAFYEGQTFAGIDNVGVAAFDGTSWRIDGTDQGLYNADVYELTITDDGLFAATGWGVSQSVGEREWSEYMETGTSELINDQVHTFFVDSKGNEWFGTIDKGLSVHYKATGQWEAFFADQGEELGIRRIAEDREGGIWVATAGGGLQRRFGSEWTVFDAASGMLPSDAVNDVAMDKYGRIWAATDGGLVYTRDLGATWVWHSLVPVWDIEFGCIDCPNPFADNHLWLVWKGAGIGHVRIPPETASLEVIEQPEAMECKPNDEYIFKVKVDLVGEVLTASDGLFAALPPELANEEHLLGAHQIIQAPPNVDVGKQYTFTNENTPIDVPNTPGETYRFPWRVWQGGRFVTPLIWVEFKVAGGALNDSEDDLLQLVSLGQVPNRCGSK